MNRARWERSVFAPALSGILSVLLVLGGPFEALARAAAMQRTASPPIEDEDPREKGPTPAPNVHKSVAARDVGVPETPSGAHLATEVLPVPLLPTYVVRMSQGLSGDPWTLFDGRSDTAIEAAAGAPVRVEVQLQEPTKLAALSLLGPADGAISVFAQGEGFELRPLAGLSNVPVRAAAGTWTRIATTESTPVKRLVIEWAGKTSRGPGEIGLWGFASPRRGVADAELADQILSGVALGAMAVRATPNEGRVARVTLGTSAANQPAVFHAMLDADPRSLTRAFLVYELAGLGHWTEAVRQINGASIQGGNRVAATNASSVMGDGGLQVEEIAPSALHQGDNEIRFLPLPGLNALDYGVRHLRIVGVPLGRVVENPPGASEGKERRIALESPSHVHDLVFELGKQTDRHLLVRAAGIGAKSAPVRIDLKGLEAGWHRVDAGRLPVTNSLSVMLEGTKARGVLPVEDDHRVVSAVAVTVSAVPRQGDGARIAVSYPLHGECVGHKAYVRGFVTANAGDRLAAFAVNGQKAESLGDDASFSAAVPEPDFFVGRSWDVSLQATMASGRVLQRSVRVGPCLDPAKKSDASLVEDDGAPFGEVVRAGEARTIAFGGAKLDIPAGAVDKDVRITVRPLVPAQVPAMSRGMANVSPDGRAFRFGPHGLKFKKPVTITLPYDRASLGEAMHERHIFSFYYDEPLGKWQRIGRVGGAENGELSGLTEHFTDFVNATLAMPDAPGPASFNPNEMKGISVGSPSAAIELIAPPQGNSSGSATLSYPVEVPPGRGGIEPHLAFTYNSAKTNGWLGAGWDLSVSSIEIDTRFGAASYGEVQGLKDTYAIDGDELTPVLGSETLYRRRVEGRFERIERLVEAPCVTGWKVTDRAGTVFTYGSDASAVLADPNQACHVFRWGLREVKDTFGNVMRVTYAKDIDVTRDANGNPAGDRFAQLYPERIDYTANDGGGLVAPYRVLFVRDAAGSRPDIMSSGRGGFLERTRHRLDHVDVLYQSKIIRRYQLAYEASSQEHFFKSLLHSIEVRGLDSRTQLDEHVFDYTAMHTTGGQIDAFDTPKSWGTTSTGDPLSHVNDWNAGLSGNVGIGFTGIFKATVGGGAHGGAQATHRMLLDWNGDGMPDLLSDGSGGSFNFLRPGLSTSQPSNSHLYDQPLLGLESLGRTSNLGWSAKGSIKLFEAVGGSASYTRTSSEDGTILADANGDGFIDVVRIDEGVVKYFPGDGAGHFGAPTSLSEPVRPVSSRGSIDASLQKQAATTGFHRVAPLVQWLAPFDGTVLFTGAIQKLHAGGNGLVATVFHNGNQVWSRFIAANDLNACVPSGSNACGGGISIPVAAGDRIYTELNPFHDPSGPDTQLAQESQLNDTAWNPTITYDVAAGVRELKQPDGSYIYRYEYAADHRVAGQTKVTWTAPFDTHAQLGAMFAKESTPIGVHASILLIDTFGHDKEIFGQDFGAEAAPAPVPIILDDADLKEGDRIAFRVSPINPNGPAASAVSFDPQRIHWAPYVTHRTYCKVDAQDHRVCGPVSCTTPDPGSPQVVCKMQNDPDPNATIPIELISQPAQVFFPYGQTLPNKPLEAYVVPTTGDVVIEGTLKLPAPGFAAVLVQGVNQLYSSTLITDTTSILHVTVPGAHAGDPLFINIYGDPSLANGVFGNVTANGSAMPVNTRWYDGTQELPDPITGLPAHPMGGGYHRWYTGFYNGDLPFDEFKITFPYNNKGELRQVPPSFDLPIPNRIDTSSGVPTFAWDGPGSAYIAAGVQNPTRAGSVGAVNGIGGVGSLRAATTWDLRLEADFGFGGIAFNEGATSSDHDFFDFNGDHYADAVSHGGLVQLSNGRTFFATVPVPQLPSLDSLHQSRHAAISAHAGLDVQLVNSTSSDGKSKKRFMAGFSKGVDYGYTSGLVDWVDVNSDGLPDAVTRNPDASDSNQFRVRLNYGYRLGNEIPWTTGQWQQRDVGPSGGGFEGAGHSITKSAVDFLVDKFSIDIGVDSVRLQDSGSKSTGIGVGGGGGSAGIGGGAGWTYNVTRTLVDLVDVTGDGLPDQIMRKPGETGVLRVHQNLGDKFDPNEVLWKVPDWGIPMDGDYNFLGGLDDALEMRRAKTYSYNFKVEVCFFICIGVEGYYADGSSSAHTAMTDIDGDGRVDMVYKNGNNVLVKRNLIGAVNLLSAVHRPLGSNIALEYEREGNLVLLNRPNGLPKIDEPTNKYVLTKVDVDDGRGNHYARTIHYEPSGIYDRIERDDFGFANVSTTLEDGSVDEIEYLNRDFYRKGFVVRASTRDSSGALYTSNQFVYDDPANVSAPPREGSFFPKELSRISYWYEGTTSDLSQPRKAASEERVWDDNGNVTDLKVFAEDGPEDDVLYHVDYDPALAAQGIFRSSAVTAKDHSGSILRNRQASYYATGALKTLTNVVIGGKDPATGSPYTGDPATNPTWQFRYDPYGNLQETTDPRGYKLTYAYDDVARTYRTSILDSFGYISSSVPNYYFGTVEWTNDVNKQSNHFVFDDFGRLSAVYGPNDIGSNEPTISFGYSYQGNASALPAYAITAHKDVLHPGDPLVTATFIDGLDRVIQTKKDIEKDTGAGTAVGMIVSGALQFDARGRVVQQGQPIFDTSDAANFVLAPMKNPTLFTYDVLGRTRSTQTPDGALSTTTYGFGTLDGVTRLTTTVRDPNVNAAGGLPGSAMTTYRDVRGLVLAVEESNRLAGGAPTPLVTRYAYNPVEELVRVTDAKGNVTTADYDTVGRMVSLTSPDSGRTDLSFDLSGNLGSKQTAKLRGTHEGIRYHYDFNRLKKIEYPYMPAVTYAYGDASQSGDQAGNLAGRVTVETSEAGAKTYRYDRLGNVIEQRWVLNPLQSIPPTETYDRTMSWAYDSFGRVLSMQFPGEEIETVTYGYDRGGNVTSAVGTMPSSGPSGGTITTPYLNFIGYDEFEQRTRLVSGNGITTKYGYDPLTRRLTEVNADYRDPYLVFHELPPRPMQRLRYSYDPVGNVTQMRNDAPFDPDRAMTVAVGTVAQNFTYDDLYQLKTANGVHQEDDPWRTTYGLAFNYDGIGNIVQKAQRVEHETFFRGEWQKDYPLTDVTYTADYTYGGTRPHAPTRIVDTLAGPGEGHDTKTRLIEYDLDGNQAETAYGDPDVRRTLEWDEEDRVKHVVERNNMQLARALYDGAGERAVNLQWLEEETAYFGPNLTLRDGKVPTKHIFAGPSRIASKTGEGPEWVHPSTTVYLHDDRLGSTNYVTSSEQEIVAHQEYFPTGELWVDESNPTVKVGPKYLFTGKELDAATGLYYFGARYYDPRISQWNSPDPILRKYLTGGGPNGGVYSPLNLGLYTYTFNNPVGLVDPTGHAPGDPWYVRTGKGLLGVGIGVVQGVVPFAAAASQPHPDADFEFGRGLGLISGGLYTSVQGGSAGLTGAACTVVTDGACAPVGVPLAAVGSTVAAGGVYNMAQGVKAVQGAIKKAEQAKPEEPSRTQAPPAAKSPQQEIAKGDYRGRYNQSLSQKGKQELPSEWDAHHRIPQDYREHPDFKGFDFDAPENIQGVSSSRNAGFNVHNDITQEWAEFQNGFDARGQTPSRQQIENFANHIDDKYGHTFWEPVK
ncbi:Rhs family carbohydrate-binding protein [Pendulispora brunnea]|uniref:Rhs family carbohydrate-binding protein n=1 Tax=Pendulispora brunnea TaxID=2905690 RepID=A0ABZ2K981_9BACT